MPSMFPPLRPELRLRFAVVLTGLVAVLAVLFRQAGVPRYRTVWAEDGQLFGQCAFTDPSPVSCLVQGYDGWLQMVSRVFASLASLVPPELFSYAVTIEAALATGAAAVLITRAVADATGQPLDSILAGASVALVYPAGAEVGGNLTNLHWILFVAAAVIITTAAAGHRLDRWDAAFVLVTTATSPFGFLLVGLLALVSFIAPQHDRPRRALVLATVAIAAAQVAMAVVSPRNELPDAVVTLLSPVGWLFDQVYRRGPFGGRGLVPGWLVGVLATLAWGALVVLTARLREQPGPGGPAWDRWARWRGPLALLALGSACAAAFGGSTYLNRHDTARYDLIPAVGLVVVLVMATAMLGARLRTVSVAGRVIHPGSLGGGAVALVLAVGSATTFRISNAASNGPSYPAAYRAAAAACATGSSEAVVGISPLAKGSTTSTWFLRIPCERVRS